MSASGTVEDGDLVLKGGFFSIVAGGDVGGMASGGWWIAMQSE